MVVRRDDGDEEEEDRAGICWGEAGESGKARRGRSVVERIDQDEAVLLVWAKER